MSYDNGSCKYTGYIYCITNKINNKKYVGQTIRTIKVRWSCHQSESKNLEDNTIFHRAIRKYGSSNFEVMELEHIECNNKIDLKNQLNQLEIIYIKKLNTLNPNGYNLTYGGDSSSSVRKRKVVQANIVGEIINTFESIAEATRYIGYGECGLSSVLGNFTNMALGYYWFYYDELNKKDIKDGIIHNIYDNFKYIVQYNLEGEYLNHYYTLLEASSSSNISTSRISQCCNGNRKKANGFQWKYVSHLDNYKKNISPYVKNKIRKDTKKIAQLDFNGNILNIYDSLQSARNAFNNKSNNISLCCKGIRKSANGYVWRYLSEVV